MRTGRPFQGRGGALVAVLDELHATPSGLAAQMGLGPLRGRPTGAGAARQPGGDAHAEARAVAARRAPYLLAIMVRIQPSLRRAAHLARPMPRVPSVEPRPRRAPGALVALTGPAGRRQDPAGQGRRGGPGRDRGGQQPDLRADGRARPTACVCSTSTPIAWPTPTRRSRPGCSTNAQARRRHRRSSGPIGWTAGCPTTGSRSSSLPTTLEPERRTLRWRARGPRSDPGRPRRCAAVIIAIEAASDRPVAGARRARRRASSRRDGWTADQRQAHELLPRLLALIERSGAALRQVAAMAVGIGPGSLHRTARGDERRQGPGLRAGRPDRRRAEPGGVAGGRARAAAAHRRAPAPRGVPARSRHRRREPWHRRGRRRAAGSAAVAARRAGGGVRAAGRIGRRSAAAAAVARLAAARLAEDPAETTWSASSRLPAQAAGMSAAQRRCRSSGL